MFKVFHGSVGRAVNTLEALHHLLIQLIVLLLQILKSPIKLREEYG